MFHKRLWTLLVKITADQHLFPYVWKKKKSPSAYISADFLHVKLISRDPVTCNLLSTRTLLKQKLFGRCISSGPAAQAEPSRWLIISPSAVFFFFFASYVFQWQQQRSAAAAVKVTNTLWVSFLQTRMSSNQLNWCVCESVSAEVNLGSLNIAVVWAASTLDE